MNSSPDARDPGDHLIAGRRRHRDALPPAPQPVGPAARVVVSDAEVTLAPSTPRVKYGSTVVATGRVLDSQTGAVIAGGPVRLLAYDESTGTSVVATTVSTDGQGQFRALLRRGRTAHYVAEFGGDTRHVRGTSAPGVPGGRPGRVDQREQEVGGARECDHDLRRRAAGGWAG